MAKEPDPMTAQAAQRNRWQPAVHSEVQEALAAMDACTAVTRYFAQLNVYNWASGPGLRYWLVAGVTFLMCHGA